MNIPQKGVGLTYFIRLHSEMRETRKRVSLYGDEQRYRLDQLARALMGQPLTFNHNISKHP